MADAPGAGKAEEKDSPSVEQYLVKDPERFALNVARMIEQAGKAASAWAEPREKGERRDHVAEPMADMVRTFSKLTEYWLSDPLPYSSFSAFSYFTISLAKSMKNLCADVNTKRLSPVFSMMFRRLSVLIKFLRASVSFSCLLDRIRSI